VSLQQHDDHSILPLLAILEQKTSYGLEHRNEEGGRTKFALGNGHPDVVYYGVPAIHSQKLHSGYQKG